MTSAILRQLIQNEPEQYDLARLLQWRRDVILKIIVMKRLFLLSALAAVTALGAIDADACTGIALKAADGSRVVARTVEWSASPMQCGYTVVPRGHSFRSLTPEGSDGMEYDAVYGFVGIYTEYESFIVEGMNESGLSAGLFFFPGYGAYKPFNPANKDNTLCDMQFVSWVLSSFSSIDQMKDALGRIDLVTLDHRIGAVHWRVCEPGGRMVVVECVAGKVRFYENKLGVLTNSPGFEWHMTNLGNYVNLMPGSAQPQELNKDITVTALGGGSGMLGLPGDFTPPSRFVRAAFFQTTAPVLATGGETVMQAFHILNNFDLPVGMQNPKGQAPEGLPSATQFTAVTDQTAMKLYYRTAWNSNIRCIDLMNINFSRVRFQTAPLDEVQVQPVEMVRIR